MNQPKPVKNLPSLVNPSKKYKSVKPKDDKTQFMLNKLLKLEKNMENHKRNLMKVEKMGAVHLEDTLSRDNPEN